MERKNSSPNLNGTERNVYPVELIDGEFYGKDFISVEQITRPDEVKTLLEETERMRISLENEEIREDLKGKCVAILFYQESTRTFEASRAAAQRLGATYIAPIREMGSFSSAAKGESLPDTVRTIERVARANAIVLRHPADNSSEEAAFYAKVPVVNAGSGRKEHPTQAILDLYTIYRELGRIDDLVVTMLGDPLNGRTVKSLAKLLVVSGGNIKFNFVSPEELEVPGELVSYLKGRGAEVFVGRNGELPDVLPETDVLYVTRIQSEWFTTKAMEELKNKLGPISEYVSEESLRQLAVEIGRVEYKSSVEGYEVNNELMSLAKTKMVLMHPFPRVKEIHPEVDDDPRAAYFRQMEYGLAARMAIMRLILKKS